ncbi:MAG: TlyA family RNA methyltransferase [Candidatus Limnocylindrales bacterium]
MVVARGLAEDRDESSRLLLAGQLRVGGGDGARIDRKPGELVGFETPIAPVERGRFVSRGGDKLDAAMLAFEIDIAGLICLDVGASTGGFTDVLLQRGAARVYALDVGRGQLAEVLRADPRVVSMERTHASRLEPDSSQRVALPELASLAVIDVSFISLTRVLRGVVSALTPQGQIVALVKPQFEVKPALAPRGVVRDEAARESAVAKVVEFASGIGLTLLRRIDSPLRGPAGNLEILVLFARSGAPA